MKRVLIIAFMCCAVLSAAAQDKKDGKKAKDNASQITFEQAEHDFEQISEAGKKVSYDFIYKNTGDCPLIITRIITSCKCVDAGYPKKPLPPGKEGIITVSYNPKKQSGIFRKAIRVYANTGEKEHVIIVKGEVVP